MTPTELKQALDCCFRSGDCSQCPIKEEMWYVCIRQLRREAIKYIESLESENAALRSGVHYLIDVGGADCCAKCIYCPHPTSEDDDCDCQHKGECVDGMIKWFAKKEGKDE